MCEYEWMDRFDFLGVNFDEFIMPISGNSPVRRIFNKRDDDVLRLDIRNGHIRDQRQTSIFAQFPRFAKPE